MSAGQLDFPDQEAGDWSAGLVAPDEPAPAAPETSPAPEGGDQAGQTGYQDPHRPRPFRTIGLRELRELPRPGWVVQGLLPDDALSLIYGPANQGKSLLIWAWLLCVATGKPFFGRIVTQGHVAYVCGEGLRGLAPRIDAWLLQFPEAERPMLEQLIYEHVHVVPEPFSLIDAAAAERWVETCREYNVVAAAIDTYSRMMTGADENSAEAVSRAVDACERARAATGAAIILAHHSNADGSRERGSTLTRGAAGSCSKVMQSAEGQVVLSNDKMKESGLFPDLYFDIVEYGTSVTLRETTSIHPTAPAGRPVQPNRHPATAGSDPFGTFR